MTNIVCEKCNRLLWPKTGVYGASIYESDIHEFVCENCSRPPTSLGLNVLRDEIHGIAVEKGWWSVKGDVDGCARSPLEIHALIHTEVAEATESVRNDDPPLWYGEGGKPEGEAVELMDVVVRVLDYFGAKGWDADMIMRAKIDFNKTRTFRHGGKTK